jgi:hypothetical protein
MDAVRADQQIAPLLAAIRKASCHPALVLSEADQARIQTHVGGRDRPSQDRQEVGPRDADDRRAAPLCQSIERERGQPQPRVAADLSALETRAGGQ